MSFGDNANYVLVQTYEELVRQNLKNLLLTAPGERMMEPEFGVGLRNFLFESNLSSTYGQISSRIINQVKKYMNFLDILDINIRSDDEDENLIYITVSYTIIPLSSDDVIQILVAV